MKRTLLVAALLLPSLALAQQWEYKVVSVSVPMSDKGMSMRPLPNAVIDEGGYHSIPAMGDALNKLAAQGWEPVSISGNNLAQTVLLRRPFSQPEPSQ